ncbi:formylglycine-generating enzyme family protein [Leptothoe spongobia]|uniref:Formylglycine-generating enzyme family protein n=1 Tax=Leptothoe spongobia TAU-MAC 1115 TaxID=1967444 RepID=A0A947DHQ7_9CYAN|nr:formylglycine-generating enzyme family protein [Leptothoe spongobia]MBT9317161.1 formylglycine-generating enzyme family protein [Leptothoe spongobia TAU-MAC 1115]
MIRIFLAHASNEPSKPSSPEVSYPTTEARILDLGDGITLELMHIPGGTFLMGASNTEKDSKGNERPQHKVTIPPFWIGKYPVTQEQYQAVAGNNPSDFKGKDQPVERVSWHDAVEFCETISKQSGITVRLPSEAEWEYACRAGTTTRYYFGDALTAKQASFGSNQYGTTPVGLYPPNAYGLYDMHGNVLEWCQDIWHDNYEGTPTDGRVWITNRTNEDDEYRILRGGSWHFDAEYCRSARRFANRPATRSYGSLGFRVVIALSRFSNRL